MSVKAADLKINKQQVAQLDREASAILSRLDDEIKNAFDEGKNALNTTIPSIFNISNMQNSDAQRAIYFRVLRSLKDRGFIVQIDISVDAIPIYIEWLTTNEQREIQDQLDLIAACSKKKINATDQI